MGGRSGGYRRPEDLTWKPLPDAGPPRPRPVTSSHVLGFPCALLALIAFFALPFGSIHCGGSLLFEATGFQAATGDWQWRGPALGDPGKPKLDEADRDKARAPLELWLVPLGALAALGLAGHALAGGFERAYAHAPPVAAIGAALVLALALSGASDFGVGDLLVKPPERPSAPAGDDGQGGPNGDSGATGLEPALAAAMTMELRLRHGYWIALGASAGVLAAGLWGLRASRGAPPQPAP